MKDLLKKIEALEAEISDLKLVVRALREWIKEDAKEIKALEEKLNEYRQ